MATLQTLLAAVEAVPRPTTSWNDAVRDALKHLRLDDLLVKPSAQSFGGAPVDLTPTGASNLVSLPDFAAAYPGIGLPCNLCLKDTPEFNVVLWYLPSGARLPLHDHPEPLTVHLKVIAGVLQHRTFQRQTLPPVPLRRTTPVDLRLEGQGLVTPTDEGWLLAPPDDIVHELSAPEGGWAAFVDVTLPPYSDDTGRATYYTVPEDAIAMQPGGIVVGTPDPERCDMMRLEGPGVQSQ